MAKRDAAQKMLQLLRLYEPGTESGRELLVRGLQDRSPLVIAKAANLVREHKIYELLPHLAEVFNRLLKAGAPSDKGCYAKQALAEALCELEAPEEELFLLGSRLVQKEAAYGGPVDTAPRVRGLCAVGLARCKRRNVLNDLAELLVDPEPAARTLAVRAVLENGDTRGSALLRLRLLSGEDMSDVVFEIFSALFAFSAEDTIDFIRRYFLGSPRNSSWNLAILALGESRHPHALEILLELFPRQSYSSDRLNILEAVALTRLPQAREFLFELVKNGDVSGQQASETLKKLWSDEDTLHRIEMLSIDAN